MTKKMLAAVFEMGSLWKMPNFTWKFNGQVWKQNDKYEVITSDDCIGPHLGYPVL